MQMPENKLLSAEELAAFRQDAGRLQSLLDHIDALEAQRMGLLSGIMSALSQLPDKPSAADRFVLQQAVTDLKTALNALVVFNEPNGRVVDHSTPRRDDPRYKTRDLNEVRSELMKRGFNKPLDNAKD
jgi:hypothetical protein